MHSNLSLPLLCRLDGFACSIYEAQTERMPSQAYRFPWLCSSEMRDMREPINQTASSEEKSWLLGLSLACTRSDGSRVAGTRPSCRFLRQRPDSRMFALGAASVCCSRSASPKTCPKSSRSYGLEAGRSFQLTFAEQFFRQHTPKSSFLASPDGKRLSSRCLLADEESVPLSRIQLRFKKLLHGSLES